MSRAASSLSARPRIHKEIKPSEISDLKLQTQQMVFKTRQTRTQLLRLQEQNAIKDDIVKNGAENPSFKSKSAIEQLKKSINFANHSLAKLQSSLQSIVNDDKTFTVKELQEDIKVMYAEQQRLHRDLQDCLDKEAQSRDSLNNAQNLISDKSISEIDASVHLLKTANSGISETSGQYSSKMERLLIGEEIEEHSKKSIPTKDSIKNAETQINQLQSDLSEKAKSFQKQKEEGRAKLDELEQIYQQQRAKIQEALSKNEEVVSSP